MGDSTSAKGSLGVWSRRGFLTAANSLLAATALGPAASAKAAAPTAVYPGRYVTQQDADYERWRTAMPWQLYKAPRYPEQIVRPNHRDEVAEIVKIAARDQQRIAVKSGGHNVSEAFLRDGGLLLDLGELQELTVADDKNTVWVEPSLWSYSLLQGLAEHQRAFPVSHCATVPMGGFLLGGGIGYNHDNWGGIGCHNIVAAEVVTATGNKITLSPEEHPELFWALRGGGMGFPAVVTRLKLQLYSAPLSVMETAAIFPVGDLQTAVTVLSDWAALEPADTELMMLIAHNPAAGEQTPPSATKMAIVRAVTYAASEADSLKTLGELMAHPSISTALMTLPAKSTSLEQMSIESVNPAMGLGFGRYAVDTVWTDELSSMTATLQARILAAPSPKTHFVISPKLNKTLSTDAVFSMVGDTFVGAYTVWDDADDDAANFDWLATTRQGLAERALGQYVNEVDAFLDPSATARCFSSEAWQRLAGIRGRYDPAGIFHGWPQSASA